MKKMYWLCAVMLCSHMMVHAAKQHAPMLTETVDHQQHETSTAIQATLLHEQNENSASLLQYDEKNEILVSPYVYKNLSDAFERLRTERDQLQQEFDKLSSQQQKSQKMMQEYEILKKQATSLTTLKNENLKLRQQYTKNIKQQDEIQTAYQTLEKQRLTQHWDMLVKQQQVIINTPYVRYTTYTVKRNDQPQQLMKKLCQERISWEEFAKFNQLNPKKYLQIGMRLVIPPICIQTEFQ